MKMKVTLLLLVRDTSGQPSVGNMHMQTHVTPLRISALHYAAYVFNGLERGAVWWRATYRCTGKRE